MEQEKKVSKAKGEEKQKIKLSSVTELFKKSWEVYWPNLTKFLGLQIIFPILSVIPAVIIFLIWGPITDALASQAIVKIIVQLVIALLALASIIFAIAVIVVSYLGMYVIIRDVKKNLTMVEAMKEAKKYAASYIWLNMLVGILVLLWSLLLVIPGIIAAGYYMLAEWVLLYDKGKGMSAIKESKRLIKGYWWAVIFRVLAPMIIVIIAMAVPAIILGVDAGDAGASAFDVLNQIISLLITPFLATYMCFIYWDLVGIKDKQGE